MGSRYAWQKKGNCQAKLTACCPRPSRCSARRDEKARRTKLTLAVRHRQKGEVNLEPVGKRPRLSRSNSPLRDRSVAQPLRVREHGAHRPASRSWRMPSAYGSGGDFSEASASVRSRESALIASASAKAATAGYLRFGESQQPRPGRCRTCSATHGWSC